MKDMAPLKYCIYKGKGGKFGAIQFSYQPPHFYCLSDRKHKFYSGEIVSQASFNKQTPCPICKGGTLSSREGCVFIDSTISTAPDKYDWSKDTKITMALSIVDIGKLLLGIRTANEVDIFHDPNMNREKQGTIKKGLKFMSPNGIIQGGIFTIVENNNGEKRQVKIPATGDELIVLSNLLASIIPQALSWQ